MASQGGWTKVEKNVRFDFVERFVPSLGLLQQLNLYVHGLLYIVYEFRVEMTCEGCVNSVQNVLNKKAGVNDINVNLDNKMVSVKTTLSSDEVLQTIKKTGKECTFLGVKQ